MYTLAFNGIYIFINEFISLAKTSKMFIHIFYTYLTYLFLYIYILSYLVLVHVLITKIIYKIYRYTDPSHEYRFKEVFKIISYKICYIPIFLLVSAILRKYCNILPILQMSNKTQHIIEHLVVL